MASYTAPGWYGKLPATGDFLRQRLSETTVTPWSHWFQQGLIHWHQQEEASTQQFYARRYGILSCRYRRCARRCSWAVCCPLAIASAVRGRCWRCAFRSVHGMLHSWRFPATGIRNSARCCGGGARSPHPDALETQGFSNWLRCCCRISSAATSWM